MSSAPLPFNEKERLIALRRYEILDTAAEDAFNRITALASRLFSVPMAAVSLVDRDRQWFKASYGFQLRQIDRQIAFSAHAILSPSTLVVPDASCDTRFCKNPLVTGEPHIRFYAGAPLITPEGHCLGTLSIIDCVARAFSEADRSTLEDLAAMVVSELELRRSARDAERADLALRTVSVRVAALSGDAFFAALVEQLTGVLGVAFAFVGVHTDGTIRTLAVHGRSGPLANFIYPIAGTPCEPLLTEGTCSYRGVSRQFPRDHLLTELAIESYAGVSLVGLDGPVGVLVVMDRKPLENPSAVRSLLPVFAARAGIEWERMRANAALNTDERLERLVQERTAALQQREAEQSRLYREAREANEIKDEFIATVSHELRTPLNAILGWTQVLSKSTLPPEKARQALETIERNARAQNRLIEDILDVSRIITGKLKLELRPVELFPVIAMALDTVRLTAATKSITLVSHLDYQAGTVLGDANRLSQVLWNLLSNAIKFTPAGGRVEVQTRRSDAQVVICVSDTGVGIAEAFLPHIFERFRQADSSTTRQHSGLGLGLAIVRHLVELHKGTIEATSDGLDQGSVFTVTLPLEGHASQDVAKSGSNARTAT